MEELLTGARNMAGGCFRQGYNCAESIFVAFNQILSLNLDKDLLRLTSGFGGGFGHAGCSCGALTGSIMVIGALKGRTTPDIAAREQVYDLAGKFHDAFEERFSSTCCRALNPYPFDTQDHLKNCLKRIVEFSG